MTTISGDEAVETWRRGDFDLLLCDLAMPQSDGFTVLRRIRESDEVAGRPTRAMTFTLWGSSGFSCRPAGYL